MVQALGAVPPEHERTGHLAGRQDDHAEKDLEESQRGSGQDAPACRCPLEQELRGTTPAMARERQS